MFGARRLADLGRGLAITSSVICPAIPRRSFGHEHHVAATAVG
jgi:hypothetical protein